MNRQCPAREIPPNMICDCCGKVKKYEFQQLVISEVRKRLREIEIEKTKQLIK